MELVLLPLPYISWLFRPVVESPLTMHGITIEVAFVVGSIGVGKLAIAVFVTIHHHPFILFAILLLLNHENAISRGRGHST